MKTPSYVGEGAVILAAMSFIRWGATTHLPWIWAICGFVLLYDWMLDGVTDEGICKNCFFR